MSPLAPVGRLCPAVVQTFSASEVVAGVEQVNAVLGSPAAEQVTDTNASPWSEPRPGKLLLSIGPGLSTSEMMPAASSTRCGRRGPQP